MDTFTIRQARVEDAVDIQQLSVQLGYQPSLENVSSSLIKMLERPDYEVVVILDDDTVVGWMSLYVRYRLEDVPFLQVSAIVTDSTVRGRGFGKKLMEYAEMRAKEKGLQFIGLHSSVVRKEAHQFYENIGYERLKESYFFKKTLS